MRLIFVYHFRSGDGGAVLADLDSNLSLYRRILCLIVLGSLVVICGSFSIFFVKADEKDELVTDKDGYKLLSWKKRW